MIDPNMPFGGVKQSGTGCDVGVDWLEAYVEVKSICIRHYPPEKTGAHS